jgi:hypothetical protein
VWHTIRSKALLKLGSNVSRRTALHFFTVSDLFINVPWMFLIISWSFLSVWRQPLNASKRSKTFMGRLCKLWTVRNVNTFIRYNVPKRSQNRKIITVNNITKNSIKALFNLHWIYFIINLIWEIFKLCLAIWTWLERVNENYLTWCNWYKQQTPMISKANGSCDIMIFRQIFPNILTSRTSFVNASSNTIIKNVNSFSRKPLRRVS